jgi:hypothetical protein
VAVKAKDHIFHPYQKRRTARAPDMAYPDFTAQPSQSSTVASMRSRLLWSSGYESSRPSR